MTHAVNKVKKKGDPALYPDYQKEAGYALGQYHSYINKGYVNTYDQIYGTTKHDVNDNQKLVGDYNIIDYNGDGVIDSKDSLDGVPVSGIGYGSSPNNPIFLGDVMYTSLDDGGSDVIKTNASASNIRRVSWREHTRTD